MTNGLTGLQMLLDALCAKGLIGVYSLEGLEILNPFGTYANMLGFFLFGAWLHTAGTFKNSLTAQRLLGLLLSAAGLLGMWGVKWYTSKNPAWDGILLVQGYRHLPVVLLAAGIFLALPRPENKKPGHKCRRYRGGKQDTRYLLPALDIRMDAGSLYGPAFFRF